MRDRLMARDTFHNAVRTALEKAQWTITDGISTMPLSPQPGEILLYLDLHRVANMTPVAALKLTESLGFQPELRTRTWTVDGETQTGLYALLHYERRDYNAVLEAEHPVDGLFTALTDAIVR